MQINGGKNIKLFAKDKNILPKDGSKIEILNAQLGSFRGNMQIIFHTKDDYKELKWTKKVAKRIAKKVDC